MPLYDYEGSRCGERFERLSSWAMADSQRCPGCGEIARRLVSTIADLGCGGEGVG
jgi:putative FmdB family regulatory protein